MNFGLQCGENDFPIRVQGWNPDILRGKQWKSKFTDDINKPTSHNFWALKQTIGDVISTIQYINNHRGIMSDFALFQQLNNPASLVSRCAYNEHWAYSPRHLLLVLVGCLGLGRTHVILVQAELLCLWRICALHRIEQVFIDPKILGYTKHIFASFYYGQSCTKISFVRD